MARHCVDGSVSVNEKNQTIKLSLSAADTIPRNTDELAGFAWLYADGSNTAFAITIHDADLNNDGKNDVRDSLQNPNGWHGHNVILAAPPEDTDENTTFCIAEISDAPNAGISFAKQGTEVTVNVRNSQLTGDISDTAAAFSIVVDVACPITVPTVDVVPPGGLPLGIAVHDLTSYERIQHNLFLFLFFPFILFYENNQIATWIIVFLMLLEKI